MCGALIGAHSRAGEADRMGSPRAQVPKYFGLEDADMPAIAIHEGANDGKYFFKNAAVKKVEKWLDDFEVRSCMRSPGFSPHGSPYGCRARQVIRHPRSTCRP